MRTYVKTDGPPSYNVNPNDFTKNHMIMEFANGDSFLNVMAAQSVIGGYDYWTIRMTAIDENMDVRWSKDVYLTNGSGTRQSTTPFAIYRSADGNGFVIAGIWDPSTQPMIGHLGIQHPFYMEVSTTGSIVQTYKGETGQIDQGYAPLSITPTSDGGYISVGVASSTCYTVSQNQMGYISKMNSSFVESNGKLVVSSFTVSALAPLPIWYNPYNPLGPNIFSAYPQGQWYNGQTQRYDALNRIIEVVNGEESPYYVVTGTMTGDLIQDPLDPYFSGTAGSCDGYIARFSQSLSIDWDERIDSYNNLTTPPTSGLANYNLMDLKYNQSSDEVFVIGNQISSGGLPVCGIILRVNATVGNIQYSQRLDGHINYIANHSTQIFIDDQFYYLCGFGHDGANYLTTNGNHTALHPLLIKFNKSDNSSLGGFIVDGDNFDYNLSGIDVGYLGLNYTPLQTTIINTTPKSFVYTSNFNEYDRFTAPESLKANVTLNSTVLYFPSSWLFSESNGIVCTAPENGQNNIPLGMTPTWGSVYNVWFPSIYKHLESRSCNLYSESPTLAGALEMNNNPGSITLPKLQISSKNFGITVSSNEILVSVRCQEDQPGYPQESPLLNEDSKCNLEITNQNRSIIVSYCHNLVENTSSLPSLHYVLYDLNGREIRSGEFFNEIELKDLNSGIYLFLLKNGNDNQVEKIFVP